MPNKNPTVYISGPMRGYPDLNFAAFHDAADRFRRAGWTVKNPVEIGRAAFGPDAGCASPADFLRADVREVLDCDAMAVLPNWHLSTGAKAEAAVAVALGQKFFDAVTMQEIETPELIEIRGGYSKPVVLPAGMVAA